MIGLLALNFLEVMVIFVASFSCWLSLDRGFIWSFVGPVLLVLAVSRYSCDVLKYCFGTVVFKLV